MLKKSILPTIVLFTLLLSGCSQEKKVQEANSMIATNEYVLTSLAKKELVVTKESSNFILKGAEGKVVIFDIFATWCPPCRAAASHLNSLQEKYKDDLIVIGINIEDNLADEKLQLFRETYKANYTLVNSPTNRKLADKIVNELKLGDRYPIPIMALYKDGKYITHYVGSIQEEFIESDIKRALGK